MPKNNHEFEQVLLEYSQLHGRTIRVIDENSTELRSNEAVRKVGRVFAQFIDRNDEKNCFTLPVSKVPKVGYLTFDTRQFHDENGELKRERHIGNAVVDIKYAEGECSESEAADK